MARFPRISENYRFESNLERLAKTRKSADDIKETATSGRKLKSISSDPAATVQVLRNRARMRHIDQYRKTLDFARGYLEKTESTLTSLYENLTRAKELAIQQANTTYDDAARKAVAAEVSQIAIGVMALGNSRYQDKYVFGGFQTHQPPISPEGTYVGDDGQIFVQVDEDSFRPINVSGRDIFDTPDENQRPRLISILQNLYKSLENYDRPLLHKSMDDLDGAMDAIIAVSTSLGSQENVLDDVAGRMDKWEVQLEQENNNLESADQVRSAVDLRRAESALQFTMEASSKMLTPSLMDFIK